MCVRSETHFIWNPSGEGDDGYNIRYSLKVSLRWGTYVFDNLETGEVTFSWKTEDY